MVETYERVIKSYQRCHFRFSTADFLALYYIQFGSATVLMLKPSPVYLCMFCFQGQAVAQLCATVPNVTVFGTASPFKHEAIRHSVTHLLDRNLDCVAEVRK